MAIRVIFMNLTETVHFDNITIMMQELAKQAILWNLNVRIIGSAIVFTIAVKHSINTWIYSTVS